MSTLPKERAGSGRLPAQEIDRQIGARIRERRIMLGLTQEEFAELLGISYQQAHKYERGLNRITAGRLYTIAHLLGVDVTSFFESMNGNQGFKPTPQERKLLELARNVSSLPKREHQEAFCSFVRAIADTGARTHSS